MLPARHFIALCNQTMRFIISEFMLSTAMPERSRMPVLAFAVCLSVAFMTYFCRLSGQVICLAVSMFCAKVKLSAMPNQDVSPEVIHLWRFCRRRCCPVP